MLKRLAKNTALCFLLSVLSISCVKFPDRNSEDTDDKNGAVYIYPFKDELQNAVAELTIQTDGTIDLNSAEVEIPYLKYNKSLLFLLTQDDCKQAAYSCTWAAINGKPLSDSYYYDADQLMAGDLPRDVHYLGKTLGSTDGASNEVRFAITTTIAPEWEWMDVETVVNKGFFGNFYRFYMKSGLVWDNVIEMVNYGNGIAFHDVDASDVKNTDSLIEHYGLSQKIILDRLSGRGCKVLAEPDGNKAYITAAQSYAPIQIMTAQSQSVVLYPLKVKDDLYKQTLNRVFYSSAEEIKGVVQSMLQLKKEVRPAINVGVHGTDKTWVDFLLWLNNTYGKDGNDSIWFPSLEEYYEYNYYRVHGSVTKTVSNNTLKLTISMPSGKYFYYPSVTVNIKDLNKENITSVSSNNDVKGLSYGNYEGGVMFNIDCHRYLVEHATHYVERYEADKTDSNLADARYFVSKLKQSEIKTVLLKRLN